MEKESYYKKIKPGQSDLWKSNPPLLSKLDIELTERCNNSCIHCCVNLPEYDQGAKNKELSTEEIKTILEEAASLGCLSVRFTGGEPLLREDFEDVYIYARQLGLKVLLFTNAILITPHLAELFARVPPLEKIEVTIYGMKKTSYEEVSRIPGSFEAAWKGVNLLLEKEVPFVVKYALLPQNKDNMEEFETWASTIPWMQTGPLYSTFFDLRYRHDSEKKSRLIKSLRPTPEEGLKFLIRKRLKFKDDMKEFCSKFMYPPGEDLFSCGAGIGRGSVDAYGFFSSCLLLKHPDISYDLKKGSLKEAMINFFPEVRKMKAKNPDYLARCARCFLKGLCEQCPAKSWAEHGTLDTPVEYHCQIAHLQARHMGLIDEGEMAWEVREWRERIRKFTGKDIIIKKRWQQEMVSCEE